METINTTEELIENLNKLEFYLTSNDEGLTETTVDLIKNGICFLAYQVDDEIRFAPSRFIGYKKNSIEKHNRNLGKHGSITNNVISKILSSQPLTNKKLEAEYKKYCLNLGITPNRTGSFGHERKYWILKMESEIGRAHV